MQHEYFFPPQDGISLSELAARLGAELKDVSAGKRIIRGVSPVHRAREGDICYILSRRNRDEFKTCEASAVICAPALVSVVPEHITILVSDNPAAAFAVAGGLLFPDAMRPTLVTTAEPGAMESFVSPAAHVDPTARLEPGVVVEPMAVIGRNVEIGAGSRIGPGAVIGGGVKIGRNCSVASQASILSTFIGNNVIVHNGARIGQDGFGYAAGPAGMLKIVQIGRVIIQDNVEIGANTTIDRGTMDDTVIGEGTKIDNLVQIGHNVRIGRHCAIVSKVGIAGSTRIGNGVQIGGAAGINGHITIGDGAQIAAMSGVMADVPAGARYGGIPARPIRDFLKEAAAALSQAEGRTKEKDTKNG